MAYINLLKYMQAFQVSGELVSMIIGITKGVQAFSAILSIIVVGFALGFFVLFENGSGIVGGVCGDDGVFGQTDIGMSLVSGYTLMLGDFDLEQYTATSSLTASIALFMTFMYLVNLVMLNLLIAIMGDIFDQIQETARSNYLYSKAKLILEHEETMSDAVKDNDEMFPTWLQVLKPASLDGADDDSWVGKLRAVKKSITDVGVAQNKKVTAVDKKLEELSTVLKSKVDIAGAKAEVSRKDVDAKLKTLAADNAELKKLLLQVLENQPKKK